MTDLDRKESNMKKIIDTLLGSPNKDFAVMAAIIFAHGLEAGMDMASPKDPAA